MTTRPKAPRTYRFKARKFLNYDGFHGNASIEAYVGKVSKSSGRRPWTMLSLSDCSEQINLEFSNYTKEDRANSLYKADTLISTLQGFRDALAVEYERLDGIVSEDVVYDEDSPF